MDGLSVGIRRSAFEKLAALAIKSSGNDEASDLARLTRQTRLARQPDGNANGVLAEQAPTSRVPMGLRELDVLLALCKAASSVTDPEHANRLALQLSRYLPESPTQLFRPSPFLHQVKPSPWEILSHSLTKALLALATEFPSLRTVALNAVSAFVKNCADAVDTITPLQYSVSEAGGKGVVHESIAVLSITVSLVGFLEAAAQYAAIWTAEERLQLIDNLRSMVSEPFMIAVETASSTVRNAGHSDIPIKDWRRFSRRYANQGRPLGAMLVQEGFMQFVKSCAVSLIGPSNLTDDQLLDEYMAGLGIAKSYDEGEIALIERVTDLIVDEINLLEDGSDYLQVGSPSQQRLAFSVKSHALVGFLNCVILGEDAANNEILLSWLENTISNAQQMACDELAMTTLKCIAILARMSSNGATLGRRCLLQYLVHGRASKGPVVAVASRCLAQILSILSEDSVIATLYSLGNSLSPGPMADQAAQDHILIDSAGLTGNLVAYAHTGDASQATLAALGEDETLTNRNVVHAIVNIAASCKDDKISALAQSMLLQKVGKINVSVDALIIQETAVLALSIAQPEFLLLLKFYTRIYLDGLHKGLNIITDAVQCAWSYLSVSLEEKSPLHRLYLTHLLETIVNKGDIPDMGESEHHKDIVFASGDITPLLKPLALLASSRTPKGETSLLTLGYDEGICSLFRDAWFNIAIHGITINSSVYHKHLKELGLLASHSPPLIAEERMESLESDVELNTVLRRGTSSHRLQEQKRSLMAELVGRESDIKRLDYPRSVFLNAVLLVETLRSLSGDCSKVLNYFRDPAVAAQEMATCMNAVADKVVTSYLSRTLSGEYDEFSAPYLANQLANFLTACCHRIERIQHIATLCTDKIIRECPSALCEKKSLFALLEILTVMWSSCIQGELDEFEWQPTLVSPMGIVKVDLPDNYALRKATLHRFLARAKTWVTAVLNIAPLDVKGLLQTYLSEYDDDGSYGHIALGRSFALEMGSLIPLSDPRLGSIDIHESEANIASDFMALYTARQKYRRPDDSSLDHQTGQLSVISGDREFTSESAVNLEYSLARMYGKSMKGDTVPLVEVRHALRQAARIICSSISPRLSIVHYLVALPFQMFSKETMKLGVSLWLGVIHENPSVEPRILAHVVEAWDKSIQRRQGLFDPTFEYLDPLQTKIELLPSDKAAMLRKQQIAQDTLSPHLRVLQFFESHFSAVRLGNLQDHQLFCRMISNTLVALTKTTGHPLAREIHFRLVLFGLRILQNMTPRNSTASWKLKDQILSAALSWFKHAPRWSFGGNRLQIKAEDKVLGDVVSALRTTADIATHAQGPHKPLQPKQDLTQLLIENERMRLRVWLFPLEPERKHHIPSIGGKSSSSDAIAAYLRLAWAENPGLAIQLAARFPSIKIQSEIRALILNAPEKALGEPAALEIMFESSLQPDINSQLKYLLYWAPVNPTEALTYFLPAYGNHPFILQYAMRALESHSMDVRFYIVAQLVQALRYDALGYVERYTLETAKQSQLFAHQVIWNMKANSYKDEDSQVPDPIKPTLDRFLDSLLGSFTAEERDFYDREFSFFNEVTDVSGKLRPYIKRSKPEKKEKIEEELRKIKVEVGVYLPSNPDGVVVGIDRKSGKPLQSHAKAPYMATFRIQKTRPRLAGKCDTATAGANGGDDRQLASRSGEPDLETYEVWQSAIFKVGDDCRQDMLALQMIAAFRSIFSSVGLDVWVFPYRVTSTAPGCGVIDVLPNSISRDMLGREAVNGLYDYFVTKYGGEDSIRFQEARTNFVKSMAAYSVISYLLQFKDRHNGNIMIDDAGHIIHIDFGFCFDIAPGGVRFERAPFKLTSEMVAVMSGTHNPAHHAGGGGISLPGSNSHNPTTTQPYRWFESLVVKAFLASRPYCTKLAHIVTLMLDSGLPCFKPETLKNFRDRFVLEKSERDAAEYMRELTRKSYMSVSTKGYDQFQLMTNGIPY